MARVLSLCLAAALCACSAPRSSAGSGPKTVLGEPPPEPEPGPSGPENSGGWGVHLEPLGDGGVGTYLDPGEVAHIEQMARHRITLDVREAELVDVLRLLAEEGRVSIVVGGDVSGRVTLRLRDVPVDEALLVVLRMHGLGLQVGRNVVRISARTSP